MLLTLYDNMIWRMGGKTIEASRCFQSFFYLSKIVNLEKIWILNLKKGNFETKIFIEFAIQLPAPRKDLLPLALAGFPRSQPALQKQSLLLTHRERLFQSPWDIWYISGVERRFNKYFISWRCDALLSQFVVIFLT